MKKEHIKWMESAVYFYLLKIDKSLADVFKQKINAGRLSSLAPDLEKVSLWFHKNCSNMNLEKGKLGKSKSKDDDSSGDSSCEESSGDSSDEEEVPVKPAVAKKVNKSSGEKDSDDKAADAKPNQVKQAAKKDSDDSSEESSEEEDNVPTKSAVTQKPAVAKTVNKSSSEEDSEEEDRAIVAKPNQSKQAAKKDSDDSSEESSEEEDSVPTKSAVAQKTAIAKTVNKSSSEEDSEEEDTAIVAKPNHAKQAAKKDSDDTDSSDDSSEDTSDDSSETAPTTNVSTKTKFKPDSKKSEGEPPAKKAMVSKSGNESTSEEKSPQKMNNYNNFVKSGQQPIKGQLKNGSTQNGQGKNNKPFRRVREEEVHIDERVKDMSFEAKKNSSGSWGERANRDLKFTRGKSFKHEKTKKKRGSYRGGPIDMAVNSIKFD